MKKNRVIYYKDELSDEFSSAQIKPISIDENYIYDRKTKGEILHTFWYKIIARPLAYIFLKIKFGHKIINKEVLKGYSDKGIFIYGNHTNAAADAFIPSMVSFPKDTYVIVHPNNVSMPVLGKITPYLGAVPLPGDEGETAGTMCLHRAGNAGGALGSSRGTGAPAAGAGGVPNPAPGSGAPVAGGLCLSDQHGRDAPPGPGAALEIGIQCL